MMADEEDVPVEWVFVECRLIGRACFEIVGADESHIVARRSARIVITCIDAGVARDQERGSEDQREDAKPAPPPNCGLGAPRARGTALAMFHAVIPPFGTGAFFTCHAL